MDVNDSWLVNWLHVNAVNAMVMNCQVFMVQLLYFRPVQYLDQHGGRVYQESVHGRNEGCVGDSPRLICVN